MKTYDLNKYYKKLNNEAIIKSIISGLMIGSGFALILSFIFYIIVFNGLWISIGVGLLFSIVSSILFKLYVFKVSIVETARRLDALGLEERVVTMLEFGEQEGILLEKQRLTTQEKLYVVEPKQIKFTNILKPVIILVLVFSLAAFMTTFSTIEAMKKENPEPPIINPIIEDEEIKLKIEELRKLVKEANVKSRIKNDLNSIIDKLELDLKDVKVFNTKLLLIEQTKKQIELTIENAMVEDLKQIIDTSTVDKTFKERLHKQYIESLEERLKTLLNHEEKIHDIEETRIAILLELEDEIIKNLINNLRKIVDKAYVSQALKNDLHELIDKLVTDLATVETLPEKIVIIEETRQEILRRIQEEYKNKTTLIDELKKHDYTKEFGEAFETKDKQVIKDLLTRVIDDFVALLPDVEAMYDYVDNLENDVEQSHEDSQIKNNALKKELDDFIELLRSLIPKEDGQEPEDKPTDEELDEIVDAISDAISTPSDEEELEDDIDEEFQEAIDELEKPIEPEDPTDPEDPNDGDDGDEDPDGENGNEGKEPTIIDGETVMTEEQYLQMINDLNQAYAQGKYTDEQYNMLMAYIESNKTQKKE